MKIYRVIDDGSLILNTSDELKALRAFYRAMQKHEQIRTWGWIDTEVVQ